MSSLHYHVIFAVVIAAVHLQNCYQCCCGFTTTTYSLKTAAASSRSFRSSTTLPSSTSPQLNTFEVIATSSALGGDIIRINSGPDEDDNSGFLTTMGVPTFAVLPPNLSATPTSDENADAMKLYGRTNSRRLGLEGVLRNSNAFLLENALCPFVCESILNLCEELGFGDFNVGKNNHGAMQIVIAKQVADALMSVIGPHVDLKGVIESSRELRCKDDDDGKRCSYSLAGINRRFRVYRYAAGSSQTFAPHIDAGFPPGGVSLDDQQEFSSGKPYLLWDASHEYSSSAEIVSRLTVLIYLNSDFAGGHTKFYAPVSERDRTSNFRLHDYNIISNEESYEDSVIASVQPRAGSVLVFPQAVSEEAVERARQIWPLHEGSQVTSGNRAKYVIRTDILFETVVQDDIYDLPEEERVLFQHDVDVREVFLPTSQLYSPTFLHHVQPLYNPHMGVENAGLLLYSLVRFTKSRKVVEVGAGYTTLFLLQALKDNEDEMKRVVDLEKEGRLRLLDYPFGIADKLREWEISSSSLLCIDNCEHQKETASSAVGVARTLGLDSYLEFLKGDAFDALDTHFSQAESIDLLWCDFGVGSRMKEYAKSVWRYIRPGGFLCCHSTLTNKRTREWLENIRQQAGEDETGIPNGECVEISLLEPHKRYQNSITLLQKRVRFEEPLYSEYA